MNLKHIEELAKDKDVELAYCVSCMSLYHADGRDYEYKEDIPKDWNELTDAEKENLLQNVRDIYINDGSGASLGRICDLVMEYQYDIDGMTTSEILEILADYECDY